MKFKIRFADQIVGLFVLAAIVAVALVLILIGVNQRWFARNYSFTSEFSSGDGLFVGMPISLKGFDIGKISSMRLNDQNEVDVRFYIEDTYYNRVKRDSVLELTSSPIGLGSVAEVPLREEHDPPIAERSFIPSLDSDEGRQLVEDGKVEIPKGADVIGSVIAKINPILDETRQTVTDIRRQSRTRSTRGSTAARGAHRDDGQRPVPDPGRVNATVDDLDAKINTRPGQDEPSSRTT